MNMTDILDFFRILNAISAFTITIFSLKKSNENPVFKPIAYLTAMLGFWNLIRFFLLQTTELHFSFYHDAIYLYVHRIFGVVFVLLYTSLLYSEFSALIPRLYDDHPCNNLYSQYYSWVAFFFYLFKSRYNSVQA